MVAHTNTKLKVSKAEGSILGGYIYLGRAGESVTALKVSRQLPTLVQVHVTLPCEVWAEGREPCSDAYGCSQALKENIIMGRMHRFLRVS